MTRAEMRTLVRDILEVDDTELTDTVIDAWFEEGRDKILARQGDWPFYEASWTFDTVAGTRAYSLDTIAGVDDDVKDVALVIDEDGVQGEALYYADHRELATIWHGSSDTSGQPIYWSLYATQIHLWPKPSAVHTLTVYGWRKPHAWADTTDEPDVPTELHRAICWWALSAWYHKEEDSELAELYEQRFERDVAAFVKDIQRTPQAGPLIWGGGRPRQSELSWLQRNVSGG